MLRSLLISLTILFLCLPSFASDKNCARLVVEGDRLLIERGGERRAVLSDPNGPQNPRWSPSGELIAYNSAKPLTVVVVRADGTVVKRLPLPDPAPGAATDLGWLSNRRIYLEARRDAKTRVLVVWKVEDGTIEHTYEGTSFSISPDGNFITWLEPNLGEKAKVMLDGVIIYPTSSGEAFRIRPDLFAWSANGSRYAFVDEGSTPPKIVVVAARAPRIARIVPLPGKDPVTRLVWSGDDLGFQQGKRASAIGAIDGKIRPLPEGALGEPPAVNTSEDVWCP
jgi:dipeptidyl aminopeptidase/acylaminoacyl peptidase